ncbi:MAG TPA: glycosyltransferase [Acidimicrobiia bacterium]|nr:glycosyltransferase [Acidimicrobiia bacterium]
MSDFDVTIIVPIYRGVEEVQRCLASVVRHAKRTQAAAELLLLNDGSPVEEMHAMLQRFVDETTALPVRLLRNEQNLGFVKTVNRGMRAATGDVVVLNSDTVVTAGWLDSLVRTASADDVATVTPLTNFGSLATLPPSIIRAFGLDSDAPRIDEAAAFVSRHSARLCPEVIAGVGFCMYITRRALDICGELDEATFGRGYGEEVDFCLRASRVGFRHLIDDATFIYHEGGVSFGAEREEGMMRGSELLHARYPFFRPANTKERRENPLRTSFAALELGMTERDTRRPHVLHLLHPPSVIGGTEKHLDSLLRALFDEFDAAVLYPNRESNFVLRTMWNVSGESIEHEFLIPGAPRTVTKAYDEVSAAALETALTMFDFDAVHVQNLIGHSLSSFDVLASFDGPVVCSVRDLYLACPNHSLLYMNQEPCGIPDDLSFCRRCLPATREEPLEYLLAFREIVESRLDAVDHWVFASQSAADYFFRAYEVDAERVELIPHGAIIDAGFRVQDVDEGLIFDEPLRFAFVGLGWTKKGLAVVNELAERFADTAIEFHHFGELKERASPYLRCHGPYDNEVLPFLLQRAGIQVVLLPGPYAETFGHVMTEAIVGGIPVIGATYSALGERLRASRAGWTVDPANIDEIEDLVRNLDRSRIEILRATRAAIAAPLRSVAQTADRYAALYRSAERTPATT